MPSEKIIPKSELERLGSLLSYLITLRENKKSVTVLHQTIQDLRRVIQNIITRYYLPLSKTNESQFIGEIIDFMCEIRNDFIEENFDQEFYDYCIGKIIYSFEKVVKIKQWTSRGPAQIELLSSLPILEKFDFKLKPFIRLMKNQEHV